MSSVEETTKNHAGNKATSEAGQTDKASELSQDKSVPRSMPDDSTSNLDASSGENEGEMVPAAGRINDKGEVLDDDGNAIGKVKDDDGSKFAGYVVTQEGDILDDDGGVVGKAEPLEEEGDYTTKQREEQDEHDEHDVHDEHDDKRDEHNEGEQDEEESASGGGGLGGALGGITDTAGSAVSGATSAVGDTAKGPTDAVGDTTKGATDAVGDATGTQEVTDTVGDTAKGATDTAGDTVKGATDAVGGTADEAGEKAADTADDAAKGAMQAGEKAADTAGDAAEKATEAGEEAPSTVGDAAEGATQAGENAVEGASQAGQEAAEGASQAGKEAPSTVGDAAEGATQAGDEAAEGASQAGKEAPSTVGDAAEGATQAGEEAAEGASQAGKEAPSTVGDAAEGATQAGEEAAEGVSQAGKEGAEGATQAGEEAGEGAPSAGDLGSKAEGLTEQEEQELVPIDIPSLPPTVADKVVNMFDGPFTIADGGKVTDQSGKVLGKLAEGSDIQDLVGKEAKGIDREGNLLGENNTVIGKVDIAPEGSIVERIKEEVPEAVERLDALDAARERALPDISTLQGLKINKMGNVVDEKGNPVGRVKSGDVKKLAGRMPDKDGKVWDNSGNVIGEVEVLPERIENESSPFEDFPDATVDKFGKVIFEGRQVGVVVGDDFQKLIGKKVDAEGDILDKNGNVIGHAERQEAEEPEEPEEEQVDYSMLRDKKINKLGNVVDDKGQIWGHVIQGALKNLVGKKVGDNGQIFNDAGQVIGKAEPVPDSEREEAREPAPFEDFPGAVVADNGAVMFNGEQVGIVVQGDAKKLKGKAVDADGDILDRAGNTLGHADRWEPEEPEPEPEVDMSPLAGKRINKAGNAVDSHGDIYGRVIEGSLSRLVGKMCDKNGFVRNEGGDIIGKCELIPEAEREGMKEGPFSELSGCTVNKEGKVLTPGGDVVGRLVSGDPKVLAGRPVDDDGDILDKNGNVLGHAERWEEPEPEKDISPMSGRKVNREGNVVDENGDVIGKLTSGELSKCAGKKVDDDGDVVDQKGNTLGHVSLLEEIPEPEPEPEGETEEEREARLKKEQDTKIAQQISVCIEQSLDKIKPICKMIVERINQEEAKKEEDRDEEELVKAVRPLIEEGGKILTEANGVIRGLDPDGRISAQAKHHTAGREATPEEYHLAELLKELTGTVTETIEGAKRKLENMPKAKKGINPLWGLLSEPLFQIVAAVGLLLSGVLGLVGKLLNGLGLGGLVNNLLGGLGLTKVLDGLGLGDVLSPLTGKKKK
ncbi:hypothetical protein F5Y17DRAFT_457512 [Xylariaceae sp. FL0594]|nr:hypothetical protein F5Y17DRAFT_457512 [Xylariaceae sp. FL0594]